MLLVPPNDIRGRYMPCSSGGLSCAPAATKSPALTPNMEVPPSNQILQNNQNFVGACPKESLHCARTHHKWLADAKIAHT